MRHKNISIAHETEFLQRNIIYLSLNFFLLLFRILNKLSFYYNLYNLCLWGLNVNILS